MGYLVRAIHVDGVTGSFRAEKDTRSEALKLAKTLREEGFWVIVTGPDGETIEGTEVRVTDAPRRGDSVTDKPAFTPPPWCCRRTSAT